jgi:hypothetical protein
MPKTVTKISEAYYRATATPPHVNESWSSTEPLRMHKLCDELIARGAHQTDVGDAIDQADREWFKDRLNKRQSSSE